MKNSFFSQFTPKEPKFFPLLKQLSEVLCEASVVLTESLQHDSPTERADYYKKIKELEPWQIIRSVWYPKLRSWMYILTAPNRMTNRNLIRQKHK